MIDDPALYCVSGPGFSGEYDCLHDAIRVLRANKSGAFFQRLWSYQTFGESPGLMAEVRCDCDTCAKERYA